MEREIYTLLNPEFSHLAGKIGQELKSAGINYAIIGNTAVQAQMLSMMTRKLGSPLCGLGKLVQLDDYLRPTPNIDVAILPKPGEDQTATFRNVINLRTAIGNLRDEIPATQDCFLSYFLERDGAKRMTFMVKKDDECAGRVGVRILTGKQDLDNFDQTFYQSMVDDAYNLKIPILGEESALAIRAAAPKDLLLVKGVQARPKDDMDVAALAEVMRIFGKNGLDMRVMQGVFGENRKHYFERFEALVGKMKR